MVKKCCGRHREHSTEDLDSVRESKQNKASGRLLTFAPLAQQRAALSVHLRQGRKNLDLLTPNRAEASYFLPPYLCPGCRDGLWLFTAGSRHKSRRLHLESRQPHSHQHPRLCAVSWRLCFTSGKTRFSFLLFWCFFNLDLFMFMSLFFLFRNLTYRSTKINLSLNLSLILIIMLFYCCECS